MYESICHKPIRARLSLLCLAAFCISISQISCKFIQNLNERRNKAEADLSVICKDLQIPDNFKEISSDKTVDVAKVAFFRRFKSRTSCSVAKKHFFDYFLEKGWDQNRMQVENSGGEMTTDDFLFRDSDYLVWVECENAPPDNDERLFVISCSWGLRPY